MCPSECTWFTLVSSTFPHIFYSQLTQSNCFVCSSIGKINSQNNNSTESQMNASLLAWFNTAKNKVLFSVCGGAVEQNRCWPGRMAVKKRGKMRRGKGVVDYSWWPCDLHFLSVPHMSGSVQIWTKQLRMHNKTHQFLVSDTNVKAGNKVFSSLLKHR